MVVRRGEGLQSANRRSSGTVVTSAEIIRFVFLVEAIVRSFFARGWGCREARSLYVRFEREDILGLRIWV